MGQKMSATQISTVYGLMQIVLPESDVRGGWNQIRLSRFLVKTGENFNSLELGKDPSDILVKSEMTSFN